MSVLSTNDSDTIINLTLVTHTQKNYSIKVGTSVHISELTDYISNLLKLNDFSIVHKNNVLMYGTIESNNISDYDDINVVLKVCSGVVGYIKDTQTYCVEIPETFDIGKLRLLGSETYYGKTIDDIKTLFEDHSNNGLFTVSHEQDNCITKNNNPYYSPELEEIHNEIQRTYDPDDLRMLGKKFQIAMEQKVEKDTKTNQNNSKMRSKISELKQKMQESKVKRNQKLFGIKESVVPTKNNISEKNTFGGFRKGFLL